MQFKVMVESSLFALPGEADASEPAPSGSAALITGDGVEGSTAAPGAADPVFGGMTLCL